MAIPTDGKPATSFNDINEGWLDTIKWIKEVCVSIKMINTLKIKSEFKNFLKSTDILTKSHYNKENLYLDDIFVFPKLKCYDDEEISHKYNSEKLSNEILKFGKIIIAGENQSGKTTLCKVLFSIYRKLNYIPIYLEDDNKFLGNPIKKIEKAFFEQYESENFEKLDIKRIVPILDNFHFARYQEKYIEQYDCYYNQVLIVDDIFGLDLRNQARIKDYSKFKIREFTAIERNELIKKWIRITENEQIKINPNFLQQSIDEKTETIENYMGLIFGKGIMPSYPFFILSILSAQDARKPLDSEITSQGQCYQALIYLYLKRQGVKNDQIDIYTNFLTELAFWIYDKNIGNGLDSANFEVFVGYYKSHFNLPIPLTNLINVLVEVNICRFDSFNEFNFCYSYMYYFFIAKYLSEHIVSQKPLIDNILANLHKDENAYITVFIAHHKKSKYLLDELLLNAEILFEKYSPATLNTNELSFFDKHEDKIIKAILPSYQHKAEDERTELLIRKSAIEEKKQDKKNEKQDKEDEITSDLLTNLRRSIKTVEVMGLIIKNRAGSLELHKLEYIFEQALKVYLRILSSFIKIIKDEKTEQDLIDLLKEKTNQIIEEKEGNKEFSIEKIEKLIRTIYWNLNFGVLHGFITKAIHSLGSTNLLDIAKTVSSKENTPAIFIVNHGIKMWYAKNVRVDEIADRISQKDFSKTAERLLDFKVVEHCRYHNMEYKALQRIESKLHIPTDKIKIEKNAINASR